jgi:hypothetical protein
MRLLASLTIISFLSAIPWVFAETVTVGPGQSLQEAADKLQPGDTLLLADGTYYQALKLTKSGTADKVITIKAKTPGKAIISGAMEATPKFEKVEGDIYKAKWGPRKWKGSGTGKAWMIADGRCLYNYTNLEEMKTFQKHGGKPNEKTPREGFLCGDEDVHVRLLGGADPSKAIIALSRPDAGVLVEIPGQQHVVLEGLQFHVAPTAAIKVGTLRYDAAKQIAIRDCYFFGCHEAVRAQGGRKGEEEFGPSHITIEHCQFSNYPTYQWVRQGNIEETNIWGAIYSSVLGQGAVQAGRRACAWKVRHCYLHDCFDGIGVATTADKDPALINEYAYNLFQNCADDSIEFDSIDYAGVHAHHNVFLDGFVFLGLSPVQAGGVTIDHNLVYNSPEYGLFWGTIFKFSTPSANAFWKGGFHPLTGMTIRNNTLIHTTYRPQWGTDSKHNPYFKDNTVANNIIVARNWRSGGGMAHGDGLVLQKNNLCCGPTIIAKKQAPEGILATRNTEPFVGRDTLWWEAMAPLLPELAAEGRLGPEKEINRVNFSVSEEYVQSVIAENGFAPAEYKDVYKNLGAVPPGTKWEFPRPGPRWSVGQSALFHPPLPPSLDPWWVGFADKPSDARTVKIRPWLGRNYTVHGSEAYGAKVTGSSYLQKEIEEMREGRQDDCSPRYVVDGDARTRWAWDSRVSKEPAWLELDLGRPKQFNFLEVANVYKCVKFEIAVKRGEQWTPLHTLEVDPASKTRVHSARVPLTEAQHVRIVAITTPGAQDPHLGEVRLVYLSN